MAQNTATFRITREIQAIKESTDLLNQGISIETDEADLMKIKAQIRGPEGTCYEGGLFKINIAMPKDYPFNPPRCTFETKIWHPNISQEGSICLDILSKQWAASMTLTSVLLSLQNLLLNPEPNDPLSPDVAAQYRRSEKLFKETAKFWTQYYAQAQTPKDEEKWAKFNKIIEMGFPPNRVIKTLSNSDWNELLVVNYLLGGN